MHPCMNPIPGLSGYFATDDGRIYSAKGKGRFRKESINSRGYVQLGLYLNGKHSTRMVHQLVALAFLGEPPRDKPLVLHRDGNRTNNRLENLYYGDHSDNRMDSVRHGTHPNAGKTHCLRSHEYTPENTHHDRSGYRYCRECNRIRNRNYYAKGKAQ